MRISPFPTRSLHALHLARRVGASPIEYVLGRVLKEDVMRSLRVSHSGQCMVLPYALALGPCSRLEHLDVRPRDVRDDR